MRRLVPSVVLLLLAACGPEGIGGTGGGAGGGGGAGSFTATVKLDNSYTESLFTLVLHIKSGSRELRTETPFTDTRINTLSSASKTFRLATGETVDIEMSALSLGQRQNFGIASPTTTPSSLKDTLHIVYDYDLATAGFVIHYAWE